MTEREHARDDQDARDVADNPEWSESDIRAGRSLADFEPVLADNIARLIGRPVRVPVRQSEEKPKSKKGKI